MTYEGQSPVVDIPECVGDNGGCTVCCLTGERYGNAVDWIDQSIRCPEEAGLRLLNEKAVL